MQNFLNIGLLGATFALFMDVNLKADIQVGLVTFIDIKNKK